MPGCPGRQVHHPHAGCFWIDAPAVRRHGLDEAKRDLGFVRELAAMCLAGVRVDKWQVRVDSAEPRGDLLAAQADQRCTKRVTDGHPEQRTQKRVLRCVGHWFPRSLWARLLTTGIDGPANDP